MDKHDTGEKIPGKRRSKSTKKKVSPFKSIHHNSHIDCPGIESTFRSRRLTAWWFFFCLPYFIGLDVKYTF